MTTTTPGELLALREIAAFNITPDTGASVAMRMRDIACNAINAATARLAAKPVDEWRPIETAPKGDDDLFLVCGANDDRGAFVVRGQILWSARKANTPSHLHLHYLTHWMPLPAPPPSTMGEPKS